MCNCGGRRAAPGVVHPLPQRSMSRPVPPPLPRELTPVKTTVIAAGAGGVCPKCGWALKKVKYLDLKNSEVIEKWTCPNRQCQNHNH